MFYHWLAPLGKTYIIFNLFNYISFRAAGATVTALLLAFVMGPPVIRRLRARKVGQVVRAEGPASHQSKRGTPTMGGLIILLATVVPTLLWAPLVFSTTTSRSCRGNPAAWLPAGSWPDNAASASCSGCSSPSTPWCRAMCFLLPRRRFHSSSTWW